MGIQAIFFILAHFRLLLYMKFKMDSLYQRPHIHSLCVFCLCVLKLAGRITSKAFNLLWLFCVGPQGESSRKLRSYCPHMINPHTYSNDPRQALICIHKFILVFLFEVKMKIETLLTISMCKKVEPLTIV